MTTVNWGQTFLWPGDVTNNGIVNTVDMLYWTMIAEDNQISGPRRSDTSTAFQETLIDELWETSYPDGLNHAYADCNGDGKIDTKDLDVIVQNLHMSRLEVTPDTFYTGIQNVDPPLVMEAETEEVRKGQEARASLFLGSPEIPIDTFYAMVFTIKYPENTDTREIEKAKFVLNNSWMGMGSADLRVNVINELDSLRSHVIISRKFQKGAAIVQESFDAVGTFSIVMEDIALDRTITVDPTDTKMVSSTLTETKLYPEGTSFLYKSDGTTSTQDPARADRKVLIYPNPTTEGIVTLRAEGQNNRIQAFELYNLLGRLVQRRDIDSPTSQLRLNLGAIPQGLYLVKVKTDNGYYTGKLKVQNP